MIPRVPEIPIGNVTLRRNHRRAIADHFPPPSLRLRAGKVLRERASCSIKRWSASEGTSTRVDRVSGGPARIYAPPAISSRRARNIFDYALFLRFPRKLRAHCAQWIIQRRKER